MKDKIVEVSKEDISGKEIEGAKLQVLDKEGNIIDEWISEKEAHKVKGLKENETYILHEELAVGNYVKASDIEFTVTESKERTTPAESLDYPRLPGKGCCGTDVSSARLLPLLRREISA